MGKKNKNKNNKVVSSTNILTEEPVITIKPVNEISTTEEGEILLKESLKKMNEYCELKKKEADEYYNEKKFEADSLEEKKEKEIEKEVDKAIKQKEKEMKDLVNQAKKDADKIIVEANEKKDETLENLEKCQKELDEKYLAYTKELAELEANKISYKEEVLQGIKADMNKISEDKEKLLQEMDSIKKDLRRKNSDIVALEEDKIFYEEQLASHSIKKSQIISYEMQIKDLQNTNIQLEKLYKVQQEKIDKLNSQILLYGDNPQKALIDNAELTKKVKELQSLISNCPSSEELAQLRETNKRFEELNNKLELIRAEKLRLESENNDLRVSKDEIEALRKFIKILELQKSELQKELERNIQLYSTSTEKVFASLSLIDEKPNNEYPHISITLKELCNKFRGYLSNRINNPLYYDDTTIRTFIAGFASSSHLMILEGLSGTGKSSLPRAFADFMKSHTIEVPVQASWKDRNDLLGFYNDFKKQYKETEFLKALYTASHDPNNIYIILLDEMNLSRIEYYFADLLSVLEKPNVEDWKIELISDYASIAQNNKDAWPKLIHDGKLQISENTWFVGTANKDDSTFMITDKVYDRAVVLNFDKKGEKQKIDNALPIKMNNSDFQLLLKNASHFKTQTDEMKFREMIKYLDRQVKEKFEITFGNRIANQLEVFVPVYIECGGTVEEAVDIIFSRKILRKLEGLYDDNTKQRLNELWEELLDKYKMPISIKTIEKMIEKI